MQAAPPETAEAATPEIYDQIAQAMGQGKYSGLSATAQQSIRDVAARLDKPPSSEWAPRPNPNAAPVEWQTPAEKAAAAQPAPAATPAAQPALTAQPAAPAPASAAPAKPAIVPPRGSNVVTIPFSEPQLPTEAYAGSARATKSQALAFYLHNFEDITPVDAMKTSPAQRAEFMKATARAAQPGATALGGKAPIPDTWFDGKVTDQDWAQAVVELKKLRSRSIAQELANQMSKPH